MRPTPRNRAFSLGEAIICAIVIAILIAIFLPTLGPRHHGGGRQIKDSTQVRGLHQGLIMFAQNNQDRFPLPSLIDPDNHTIDASAESKDTTANIFSILIWNGFFGPELCVSSAETNAAIKQMGNYAFTAPPTATNPVKALWDPAFSADFTTGTSNFSYGHTLPSGPRLDQWKNTFSATEAIVGNRGPQIASSQKGRAPNVTHTMTNPASNTLLIHGARTSWEGNIAYNDNHVTFETSMTPDTLTYLDASKVKWSDCLFFDEPEDADSRNAYLGIFTRSGAAPADFKSIWD